MSNRTDGFPDGPPRPAPRQGLQNTSRRPPDRAQEGDDWPGMPEGEDAGPAGPHATPDLTDDAKTPGAGALPDEAPEGDEVDPGSG